MFQTLEEEKINSVICTCYTSVTCYFTGTSVYCVWCHTVFVMKAGHSILDIPVCNPESIIDNSGQH